MILTLIIASMELMVTFKKNYFIYTVYYFIYHLQLLQIL